MEEKITTSENMQNTQSVSVAAKPEDAGTEEGFCEGCGSGHYKKVPRDAAGQKQLQNRINRIVGQLSGIKNMIDENRYCGDILIQIAAVESALQSLGYIILQEHMQTCVVEEVKNGNEAVMEEAMDLIRKLK